MHCLLLGKAPVAKQQAELEPHLCIVFYSPIGVEISFSGRIFEPLGGYNWVSLR